MDQTLRTLSRCGVVLALLITGALASRLHSRTDQWIDDALLYARLTFNPESAREDVLELFHRIAPEFADRTGVTTHDPERAVQGATFYSSRFGGTLIDMEGKVLHQWTISAEEVWPAKRLKRVRFWRKALLDARTGEVTVLWRADQVGAGVYGIGPARLDRDGRVVWRFDGHCHHDITALPDGGTLVLCHRRRFDLAKRGLPERVWEDYVVVLDARGQPQREVSILEALVAQRENLALLERLPAAKRGRADITHTNDIEVVTEALADRLPLIEPGQWLVCMRNLNVIGVLDPIAGAFVHFIDGPWHLPHDPDVLPNGLLLVFDNLGLRRLGWQKRASRLLGWNLSLGRADWQYPEKPSTGFFTASRGSQQPLPGGNILVTSTNQGRLLEITPSGEVVWDYFNPHRSQRGGGTRIGGLFAAQRIPWSKLRFLPSRER